ncbi:ABC transporter ATP-binding protein [Thiopseudomonas denitrificans]|uniref:Putative ABC transport system ATP-binding protein n=1 Tax=Thiopseudomonas denitrificans TaxID=1501432 RepID=A0A4R6TXA6_9GAMM|nr:ABC transporter ATP-binding protein [Thiopseudomonas denitrificans]TDQ36495.1 putative ABC transport system ATP-binding protein [Thiopseudomonas denitrificans]
MSPLIEIRQLAFAWPDNLPVLQIEHLQLERGEHLFIQGASGSGKSTLLNVLGGVLTGFTGEVRVNGLSLAQLSARQRDRLRADCMGVLFQQFNLLPYLSLEANVSLPCVFSRQRRAAAITRSGSVAAEAKRLLQRLGLSPQQYGKRPVAQLSIGQQQRVAAARALIGSPLLLIADEPTSALDGHSRDLFMQLLMEELQQADITLLLVSHDPALARYFSRTLKLEGNT